MKIIVINSYKAVKTGLTHAKCSATTGIGIIIIPDKISAVPSTTNLEAVECNDQRLLLRLPGLKS